ncbi:MAG: hemerythrin family protein [Motiliproteus sp.]
MEVLELDPSLLLGVKEIDEQHKELVDLINHSREILQSDQDLTELAQIFHRLEQLVIHHFSAEELLMVKYKYPGLKHHKEMHDISVNSIFDLDVSHIASDPSVGTALVDQLSEWLFNHIKEDVDMVTYLKSKGAC